jgi:hypothetical protein
MEDGIAGKAWSDDVEGEASQDGEYFSWTADASNTAAV